jgi:diketogulonate reductase-like aldo/keto reductase
VSDSSSINRRQFLTYSATLAAAASLPFSLNAQETMRTRLIPGTGESLPVVGLGSPDIFKKIPPEGKSLPKAVIQAMVDLGGRLIDAPAFFRSGDPVLGEILTEMDLQQQLFLTGKITVSGKQAGIEHLERTERILNKRPMDCLMIHNMREMETHWPTLKAWKESGRVRYIGVSRTRTTDFSALEKFMKVEKPDFLLIGYSITQQGPANRILPLAADIGTAVIAAEAFKASEDGGFFGMVAKQELPDWTADFDCESWAQFSLKYILSNPAITSIVTETRKVHHVIDNMRAGYGRLPDQTTRQRMSAYLHSL